VDKLREIAESFREHLAGGAWRFYLLLGGLIIFSLSFTIIYRWIEPIRRRRAEALEVFYELCNVNGIDRKESKILRRFAKSINLKDPSILFVRPSLFEKASENFQRPMLDLDLLRRKLFE
jgi:hypothetical protein